jgi:PGF-CTERM protein
VLVESARLPDGGFVTIHDATVSDDPFGSVRGTSAYLDSGTSADINVSLDTPVEESGQFFAMPHRDTDGDETYDFVSSNGDDDGPYLNADGQIVLDSGQISLAGEMTATPTPTEADEPTPTEADEPTPTEGEETTTTSSDGQPGFGLAVSLIALVGAALIALRRRD